MSIIFVLPHYLVERRSLSAHTPVTGERILWICEDIAEAETAHEGDKNVTLLPPKIEGKVYIPYPFKIGPKNPCIQRTFKG